MAAEMINEEAPEQEEPGWDEFTPSEVKEGLVEFTYRLELPDVNRTRGLPDKPKLEELIAEEMFNEEVPD